MLIVWQQVNRNTIALNQGVEKHVKKPNRTISILSNMRALIVGEIVDR